MLKKSDIENAENGSYASFFEAVKRTLEEKLEQNSFIKSSMNKIEYYKNLTKTLGESELEDDDDDEDEELEDSDDREDNDDDEDEELEDSDDREDNDDDDEDDEDDED